MNRKRNRVSAAAVFLLASLVLAGCSYIESDVVRNVSFEPARYKPGETSWRTMLRDLGPPDRVGRVGKDMAWLYEDPEVDELQAGVGLQYEWLSWFKAVYATADADRTALLLLFDENRMLKGGVVWKWKDNLGTGSGVQLILTMEALVDSDSMQGAPLEIEWGKGLLQPLPVVLNTPWTSSLQGRGLELRGTPLKIGQHTLEMR